MFSGLELPSHMHSCLACSHVQSQADLPERVARPYQWLSHGRSLQNTVPWGSKHQMGWNCDSLEAVIGPHMKPPPVRLTVPLSRPPCAAAPGTAMAAVVAADDGSILLRGLSPTSGDPGRRGSNSSSVPALSNRGAPGTGKMHGQNDLFLGYLRPIPLQGPPKRFFLGCVIPHWARWEITQPRKNLFGGPCTSLALF